MENQFAVSENEICALFDKICITETQNFDKKASKRSYAMSLVTSRPIKLPISLAEKLRGSYELEIKQKSDKIEDIKARTDSAKEQIKSQQENHRQEVKNLESENQKLWERLDREMANGEELHNELMCLRAQFETEKAEIRISHELSLKEKSEQIEDLKAFRALTEAKWKTSEIEALKVQLEFSIRRITDLSLSQNELKRAHELELKEKSDEIEDLKASQKAHKIRIKHLESKIMHLNESVDSEICKKDAFETELLTVSWEKAELERIMTERAVNELESLEARFEAKFALLSSSKQFEIETIKAEFKKQISELSQQIESQAKEANKTSYEMSEQLNLLNTLMKSNEDELAKRSRDLEFITNDKSALVRKIEHLKARLAQVENEKAQLEQQIERKSKGDRKLVDEINEFDKLVDELASLRIR